MKNKLVLLFLTLSSALVAAPAFAVAQEGSAEPGQGLTAVETVLYFVLAPFGLFLAIVVIGYAIHCPKEKRNNSGNALSEIK
jgi:hypothetical protein